MAVFDPYHKWLGIPPADQPPNHYRLLGLNLFEADPDVIDVATEQRVVYLRGCATGEHIAASQKLLNEVAAARLCLLNSEKKRKYDANLRKSLEPPSATLPQDKQKATPIAMPWESQSEEVSRSAESESTRPESRRVRPKSVRPPIATTWVRVAVLTGVLLVLIVTIRVMIGGKEATTNEDMDSVAHANPERTGRDPTKAATAKATRNEEEFKTQLPSTSNSSDSKPQSTTQEIADADAKRLQGRWECVFEEGAGKESTAAELAALKKVLTVDGTELTIQRVINGVAGEYRGTFTLGGDGERRLFDFLGTAPNGRPVKFLGLYDFDGEVFKVCYRVQSENDLTPQRADSFGTTAYSNRVFNKYRRVSAVVDISKPGSLSAAQVAPIRYEAERCKLGGQARQSRVSYASGGSKVVDINSRESFIECAVIMPTAGQHRLVIRYSNGFSNRPAATHNVSVNGQAIGVISYPSTRSWSNWATASIVANLPAGQSTIRLSQHDHVADIDYLELSLVEKQ